MKKALIILFASLFIVGCSTSLRKIVITYMNTNEKKYIIEKHQLQYWGGGVYDINRNGEVEVGKDFFFFSEDNIPDDFGMKADFWYLHKIEAWEDDGKEIVFKISPYPTQAMIDYDADGYPDTRYRLKTRIEHDGYKLLQTQSENYINRQLKKD